MVGTYLVTVATSCSFQSTTATTTPVIFTWDLEAAFNTIYNFSSAYIPYLYLILHSKIIPEILSTFNYCRRQQASLEDL
ncbi:hypothetical protein M434DRAFT_220363 [Hypoxylon sp. CO27-5]|nr:hypothetical protein M434DRAFT_220363 [Hypoxylon sp. CO27-5]